MVQQADKHRSEREFEIGDFVFLKLHPYRQNSLRHQTYHKLLSKYYDPFKVLDKIGKVAYKLDFPSTAEIHNVSQLKLCPNPSTSPIQHLHVFKPDASTCVPAAILARKIVKRGRVEANKVFVQWKDSPPKLATWEYYYDLLKKFPR